MLKPLNESGYKYEGKDFETKAINENIPYKKQETDDLEKEMGKSLKPKAPWQKRRRKEAAFISVLWFIIFLGVVVAIILVSVASMILKY